MAIVKWGSSGVVVAGLIVGLAVPAGAHSCAEPITIVEGADATVAVGVTLGDEPSGEIRLEFDRTFEIADGVGRPGWTVSQNGGAVTFTGGPLEGGTCAHFDVPVRALAAGTYKVRAFQTLANGQSAEHPPDGDIFMQPDGSGLIVNHAGPPDPAFEQVIYVERGDEQSTSRTGLLAISGFALLVTALVVVRWARRDSNP